MNRRQFKELWYDECNNLWYIEPPSMGKGFAYFANYRLRNAFNPQLVEAFVSGARWARMASEKAFDDTLLEEDAKYFAESDGTIRCRGAGTLRHVLRTEVIDQLKERIRQARAIIEPLAEHDPAIREWLRETST